MLHLLSLNDDRLIDLIITHEWLQEGAKGAAIIYGGGGGGFSRRPICCSTTTLRGHHSFFTYGL